MSTNLTLWHAVERTDPSATKQFKRAGGFSGTAINATWLAKRATERFGPMGIGWGLSVIHEAWFGVGEEQVHYCRARLWYVHDGQRGEVEHVGCTSAVIRSRDGSLRLDEEAPKKSLTDAMSKALSMLGFAADVHLGLYDDNKYVQGLQAEKQEQAQAKQASSTAQKIGELIGKAAKLDDIDTVMKSYAVAIKGMQKTAPAEFKGLRALVEGKRAELAPPAPPADPQLSGEDRNAEKPEAA